MATVADMLSRDSISGDNKKIKELMSEGRYLEAYKYILDIDEEGYFYRNQDSKRKLYSISHKHQLLRKLKEALVDAPNDLLKLVDESIEEQTLKDIKKGSLMANAIKQGVNKRISHLSSNTAMWIFFGFIGFALLIGTIINPDMRSLFTFLFCFGLIGWSVFTIFKIRKKK